ncbi:single-stranded DNA-binding protein [Robertkochia solimangrovi]|uniref:single-stranded DNA-binding protein n=1 Tax=Robertkochia solimangrovi TaxID=2213046 RepID=UPI00117FCE33|nr:single-stranded DNA-binding protein [Robertkochia solimangrovi]TRZ46420.1 single-stranded DNA-binding protein [Robertkochia solimangrovi]
MNALRNRVQLIGNLGSNPEIFNIDGGGKMAKFNMATNERHKNSDGEWVSETQWHTVVAFGKLAGIIEKHLAKGYEVAVEGKLRSRSYDGKDGVRRYVTEISCNELLMLKKS